MDDNQIQEKILGELVNEFQQNPESLSLDTQTVTDSITQNMSDVQDNDVSYNIRMLSDKGVIDHSEVSGGPDSITMKYRTIEEYERLSGDTVIPQNNIDRVLEKLYRQERNNPSQPNLSRNDLKQQTGLSDTELDRTIWYLNAGRYIDAGSNNQGYTGAKIAQKGRDAYE